MSTFETYGVRKEVAKSYLDTPEGRIYLDRLHEASPKLSPADIAKRAIGQITSGRELPRMEIINDPLVKIVPQGSKPTDFTPFWAKESDLDAASKAGKNLSDHFGLPKASEALKYDVYKITPKTPTEVFVNTVAPTSEGALHKPGGATQYLTPNRNAYTPATYLKTVDNLHIPLQKAQAPHDIDTAAHAKTLRINKVVKGMGIAGTVYGVGMGVLDVKHAVDAAQTSEEKWRVGGQQGADVATRGLVTGVAAAVCAVPGAIGGTAAGANDDTIFVIYLIAA